MLRFPFGKKATATWRTLRKCLEGDALTCTVTSDPMPDLIEWAGCEMLTPRCEASSGPRQRRTRKRSSRGFIYDDGTSERKWIWTRGSLWIYLNLFLSSVCLNHMHKSRALKIEEEALLILLFSNPRQTEESICLMDDFIQIYRGQAERRHCIHT